MTDRDVEAGFEALYRRLDEAERALAEGAAVSAERRRAVLAERARVLAGCREAPAAKGLDVVAFAVGGERYAVRTEEVEQVLDVRGLTPLPGAPAGVIGMIQARSRILPVLDLRQLLGLAGGGMSDLAQALVVGGESPLALAVERVDGRLELPAGGGEPPVDGPFLQVAADRLAVLDLARIAAAIGQG